MSTWTMPRRVWPSQDQALIPHPEPEVPCRDANEDEIPNAAKRMRKLAEANGWEIRSTYARGTRTGNRPKVVDSLALRMHANYNRAIAIWIDGKWSLGLVALVGYWPRSVGAREMAKWLAS